MLIRFEFAEGGTALCEVLGSVKTDRGRYAAFKDVDTNDVYFYKYSRTKKGLRFTNITGNEEFKEVYRTLVSKIRIEEG